MKNFELNPSTEEQIEQWQKKSRRGRIALGLVLVSIAGLLIINELGMLQATWLLSWPMVFVAFGFIFLIKHGWRHPGWIFMMGFGAVFLTGMLYPDLAIRKFIFPAALAFAGLLFIFRPKRKCGKQYGYYKHRHLHHQYGTYQEISSTEDEIKINNSFSGTKRSVISKNFKGGEIRNSFGGCELNLMHAELESKASIRIDQQFAGLKLIVPSHWRVQSEVHCVLASVEDQRNMMSPPAEGLEKNTLILTGNIFMSGVEIVSY